MKKYLVAPWRSGYIENLSSSQKSKCIFCEATKKNSDAPVLEKGKKNFVIMNLYPYNTGHVMIVPYKHTNDILNLDEDEITELMKLTQKCIEVLKSILKPHGFNIGMNIGKSAGAGFADHIHLHIVPRWQGDESFLTIVGKSKVISVDVKKIFKKLKKEFNKK
ncbi:HIT domain-containing protein [Candidatus Desantisbacteria bacterium]|nr:HIT domain-containing protein [Candidatus Desantisbacteria bacterium]